MKLMIHGSTGRMGQNLYRAAKNHTVVAGVSPEQQTDAALGLYHSLSDFTGEADVLIDFSHHTAIGDVLDYAVARGLAVVIGTTGQTPEEKERIIRASEKIPVFWSGNMSVGIALLVQLAKQTARAFPEAEIEIIETHHDQKLDVPSGTALMLADGIKSVRENATYNIGRPENGKRTKEEIGIHAIRLGNVVGIHEILISTGTQTITLRHEAHDRMLFAEGAMAAAEYLAGKPAGLYNMETMLA